MEKPPIYLAEPGNLPSLPDVYLKVKKLLDAPGSNSEKVAATIAYDPALTTRFLSVANSALFAPASEITSVDRAVTFLGTQVVHDLVLSASVSAMIHDASATDALDINSFWRRSISTAVLAKTLAEHLGLRDAANRFIEGLLADIGHLVMWQHEPDRMHEVATIARDQNRFLFEVEQEILGYDFCDLSAYLATQWELPSGISSCLENHQQPQYCETNEVNVALVHVAYRLAHIEANDELVFDAKALEFAGITNEIAEEVRLAAETQVNETIGAFSAN